MAGFVIDIEKTTLKNDFFRRVLFTTDRSQLVVMALQPSEEIGMEVHPEHDQFIRVETGKGKVIMEEEEKELSDGIAVVIPAGTKHNVINTSDQIMRLYTIYTPPEHKDGTIHKTKKEAAASHH